MFDNKTGLVSVLQRTHVYNKLIKGVIKQRPPIKPKSDCSLGTVTDHATNKYYLPVTFACMEQNYSLLQQARVQSVSAYKNQHLQQGTQTQ